MQKIFYKINFFCIVYLLLDVILVAVPDVLFHSDLLYLVALLLLTLQLFTIPFLFGHDGYLKLLIFIFGVVLYFIPYMRGLLIEVKFPIIFYALYIFLGLVLLLSCPEISIKKINRVKKFEGVNWGMLSSVGLCLAVLGGSISSHLFLLFYAVSCLFFERYITYTTKANKFFLLLFSIVCFYFLYVVSNSMGRVFFASLILIPLVISHVHGFWKIRISYLVIAIPLMVFFAAVVRSKDIAYVEFGGGSFGHHLTVMSDLRVYPNAPDLFGWVGQTSLFYLNWVPRVIWDDKPIGLGYLLLDTVYDREDFGPTASFSTGIWGEHLYYLHDYWIFFGICAIVGMILFRRLLFNFSEPLIIVVFDVSLLSYFWGGSGAFGGRFWWIIFPLILYLMVERIYLRHRSNLIGNN